MEEVKSDKPDESHALVATRTDADGVVRYRAGYGWQKAGVITMPTLWQQYLSSAGR